MDPVSQGAGRGVAWARPLPIPSATSIVSSGEPWRARPEVRGEAATPDGYVLDATKPRPVAIVRALAANGE